MTHEEFDYIDKNSPLRLCAFALILGQNLSRHGIKTFSTQRRKDAENLKFRKKFADTLR